MTEAKPVVSWLTDMDGVLVHEGHIIPGADKFIQRLRETNTKFLVLTNNPMYTPRDLQVRLRHTGIDVPLEALWTSALATAKFLDRQRPCGTAYAIGEAGLTTALHDVGYVLTDVDPEYVVLGDTREFSSRAITTAIRLIRNGARFVATNPDPTGPSTEGVMPSTGSMAALISKATGVQPYFIGKPNPLMMREALDTLDAHSETTVMVGDRMDTDVISGSEAGMRTILVLTGITSTGEIDRYPFRPTRVVPSIADLIDDV
jgi:NagD protein